MTHIQLEYSVIGWVAAYAAPKNPIFTGPRVVLSTLFCTAEYDVILKHSYLAGSEFEIGCEP